jgi:hypothetical protein
VIFLPILGSKEKLKLKKMLCKISRREIIKFKLLLKPISRKKPLRNKK